MMPTRILFAMACLVCLCGASVCHAEKPLFEDTFDKELSPRWVIVGLEKDDYRIRGGGLELRVQPEKHGALMPRLQVELPFTTADTVIASVDVTVVGEPLLRGADAGLALTDKDGPDFRISKTNIDGYFVFAPGEVEFIGQPGEEGDPSNYTVKYWPAKSEAGPLRVIIRGHYAHAQVGPSKDGKYRTLFHSAIQEADKGLGFALLAVGPRSEGEQWVRFDNFRVTK